MNLILDMIFFSALQPYGLWVVSLQKKTELISREISQIGSDKISNNIKSLQKVQYSTISLWWIQKIQDSKNGLRKSKKLNIVLEKILNISQSQQVKLSQFLNWWKNFWMSDILLFLSVWQDAVKLKLLMVC